MTREDGACTSLDRIPRRRISISTRLTLWYSFSLLILLSLFVIFLYAGIHRGLHRDFNEQLSRELEALSAYVNVDGEAPSFKNGERLQSVANPSTGSGDTFVRLVSPSGAVLEETSNFEKVGGFTPRPPHDSRSAVVTHRLNDGPARTMYRPIPSSVSPPVAWLEITRFESALHRDLHRLEWLMVVGMLSGLLVASASGYALARRALRPVSALTEAAGRIRPTDLDVRLPHVPGVRDELSDLAETFNGLLERLHASSAREQRFRADAAHEMFTPISAVQSEVDVALRRGRDPDEYRQVLSRIGDHAQSLSRLLDELLELSRAEAGSAASAAATDLSRVVRHQLEQTAARATSSVVEFGCQIMDGVIVAAETDDVRKIVDNLIDNAIKYTPAGGRVNVIVTVESGEGILTVTDTGPGFNAEDRPRLFDRFFRADQDVVRGTRGSGLGLSIVRALAERSGGSVEAHSAGPGQGSMFIVRWRLQTDTVSS